MNLPSGLTRVSFPGFAAYAAVKGAVEVLTVYMAMRAEGARMWINHDAAQSAAVPHAPAWGE